VGVLANEVTYNSLIKAYAGMKPSQPAKCEALMQRMHELNIQPDVISYSSLATAYGNATPANAAAAEGVLERMAAAGLKGNTITYSSIVAAYANATPADVDGAERVVRRMKQDGVKMNTITYCNLISAYRAAGRAPEAAAVLDRMSAEGIKADAVCYNAVIKAFSNQPQHQPGFLEAYDVAERMLENGLVPNIVTANLLLECAARDLRREVLPAAQRLFSEIPMSARDKYTYPRMLHVLANFNQDQQAFNLFHEARDNLPSWPNEFVFKAVLRACPKQRQELQHMWNDDARSPRDTESKAHIPQRNREGKQRRPIGPLTK